MLPVDLGVKVTLIAQPAPDERLELQSSVSPKFAVAVMPVMFSVFVP